MIRCAGHERPEFGFAALHGLSHLAVGLGNQVRDVGQVLLEHLTAQRGQRRVIQLVAQYEVSDGAQIWAGLDVVDWLAFRLLEWDCRQLADLLGQAGHQGGKVGAGLVD